MIDMLLHHLYASIPPSTMIDIGSVMLLTMLLIICDVFLRLLIEATRYNRDTQRSGSVASIVLTMLWRGWGTVKRNGKSRRYMMSKGFRNALAKKMLLQYPGFFIFSVIVYIYPDYEIFEIRIDEALSVFLLSLPVLCETMSIIENLNEIDPDSINALAKIIRFFNRIKG